MSYAKSKQTRELALKSTARLLRAQGYAATGLRDIVEDSGIPKGSLYHHFPGGKEEIAAASLHASGSAMKASLDALAEASGDPITAVIRFCDRYVEQLEASGYALGCPLATVALETAADVDTVQRACGAAFEGVVEVLVCRLEDRGLPEDDARDAALFTVAAIEGALLLAKAQRSTHPLTRVRDQIAAHLRHILEPRR